MISARVHVDDSWSYADCGHFISPEACVEKSRASILGDSLSSLST